MLFPVKSPFVALQKAPTFERSFRTTSSDSKYCIHLVFDRNHYNLDALGVKLLKLFEKEDLIAVSLFLKWFKILAVDGRIDSSNYRAFEKIYTNQMEVRDMFGTAISEKDKRLIQEGEAKGRAETLAEFEAKIRLDKEKMATQMKQKGYPIPDISEITGLSIEEIELL